MRILSLMSGSSLDGCDIGLIELQEVGDNFQYSIQSPETIPYNKPWALRLKDAPKASSRELAKLDYDYSFYIADLIADYVEKHQIKNIDVIGFHGHTVMHEPELNFTHQVGNGGALNARTGIPVICDFRSADIALGGQGTPMAPIADVTLFSEYDVSINLGGICNITIKNDDNLVAYDVCPCNQVLDFLAGGLGVEYDVDGQYSSKGQFEQKFYDILAKDAYYSLPLPKSLDNFYIQRKVIDKVAKFPKKVESQLHTCCHFIADKIAESILQHYHGSHPIKVLLAGGGANNRFLTQLISDKVEKSEVVVPPKIIIDYKEILLIALASYLRLVHRENILAQVTGASHNTIGGAIYDGR